MNVYKKIKEDMISLGKKIDIPCFYLQKNTQLKLSMRYTFSTSDIEANDDEVDVVRVDFILNLYVPDKIHHYNDIFEKAIREFDVYDYSLIGTEEEKGGGYNTAFIFTKNYIRSE